MNASRASIRALLTILLTFLMAFQGTGSIFITGPQLSIPASAALASSVMSFRDPADDWPQFHLDAARTGNTTSPAPAENTTIWELRTGGPVNASPVVSGDAVYASSTDGLLYALNGSTGALLWKARTGGPILSSPAVAGGFVYVGSDDGYLHGFSASDGTEHFNYSAGAPVRSPVLLAGGAVIFGADNGCVTALDPGGGYIWSCATYNPVTKAPSSAGGSVFVSCGKNLTSLNITTGYRNWVQTLTANLSHPVPVDNRLYVASEDGLMLNRDQATGGPLAFNITNFGLMPGCPATVNSSGNISLLIGNRAGRFYRLNLTNQWAEWNVSVGSAVDSSAAVSNGTLIFGTGSGLLALNLSGAELWNVSIPGGVASSPAISSSRAFLGTVSGSVIAIGHRPRATILSVSPAQAAQGMPVQFSGTSPDSVPVAYQWRSNLDRSLSNQSSFTIQTLSLGLHTVSFRVQDRNWTWSAWDTAQVEVLPPEDWPFFLKDSSHRGATAGEAPLTNTMVWKKYLGGRVYSSPVVYGNTLFVGTRIGGALYALDVTNGSQKWYYSDSYGGIDATPACADNLTFVGDDAGNLFAFQSDPSDGVDEGIPDWGGTERDIIWTYKVGSIQGSPVVVNGKVFAASRGDAKLYAFDEFKGTPLWNFTLPDVVNNSIWSSPASEGGLVMFGASNGRLYAIDTETGAEVWNFSAKNGIKGSPCIYNDTVYFGSSDARVYAVYLSNGSKKWEFTTGDEITASPAASNGKIYIGSYDNYFRSLDAQSGQEIWKFPTGDKIHTSAAVGGGLVFFGSYDGKVYALNESTFKLNWSYDAGSQLLRSSPALAGGRLYIGTETGYMIAFGKAPDLYVPSSGINFSSPAPVVGDEITVSARVYNIGTLNATARVRLSDGLPGTELGLHDISVPAGGSVAVSANWTVGPGVHTLVVNVTNTIPYEANTANNLASKQYAPPAQAGWTMYKANPERTSSRTNITTPNSNNITWTMEAYNTTYSSPVTSGGRVYLPAGTSLIAMDKRDGSRLWSYEAGSEIRSTPAVSNLVVLGTMDGRVLAINEADGSLSWSYPTGAAVTASPLIEGEMVYVGSEDGYLYAISLATGQLDWKTLLAGPVMSSAALDPSSQTLVVGSLAPDGGRVMALHMLDGKEAWNVTVPAPVVSTPAIFRGKAYIGCDDGKMYAFEVVPDGTDDGSQDPVNSTYDLLWNTNISLYVMGDSIRVRSSPAVSADGLYVGVGYNTLVALTLGGAHLWHRDLGTPKAEHYMMSSPALTEGRLFVGADGTYAVNARNGALIWSSPGDWVWASPAISVENATTRGMVLSVTEAGRLCAFSNNLQLPPTAVISSPADGQVLRVGELILFNGSSSWDVDGEVVGWSWSFGDGNSSTAATVQHNYSAAGEYIVSLTVTDDKGLTTEACVTVSVRRNSAPSLRFPLVSPDTGGDVGTVFTLKVTYSDSDNDTAAFVRAVAGGHAIVLQPVDPNDNNTADGKDFHCETGLPSGIYSVLFEASDGVLSNSTQVVANLTVTNRSVFSYQSTVFVEIFYAGQGEVRITPSIAAHPLQDSLKNAGLRKVFSEFEITASNMDKWWWASITVNFSTFDLSQVNRSTLRIYRYNATTLNWTPGENPGIDMERNNTFINVTTFSNFTVLSLPPPNHPPTAKLSKATQTILEGETVTFNASGSFDPDNQTLTYHWDFGDSANKTPRPGDKIAEHKYTKAGRYIVTLTVSDGFLNATTTTEVIVKQKGVDQTLFIIIIIIVLVVGIIFVLPRGKEGELGEEKDIQEAPPPRTGRSKTAAARRGEEE